MDNKTSKPQKILGNIIKGPDSWVRGYHATDKDGVQCSITDKKACRFCLSGGLRKMEEWVSSKSYSRLARIVQEYADETPKYKGKIFSEFGCTIPAFNDCELTTWEDIQEVVRRFDAGRLNS